MCGVPLPAGPDERERSCREPIFTPATKAEAGEHDENITSTRMARDRRRRRSPRRSATSRIAHLPRRRRRSRSTKGMIIADTKFEFGLDDDGTLTLMDEVLTPDSSRYWPVEGYGREGSNPPSFDKQFVRDWLEQVRIDGKPWDKTPPAPRCRRT